ncbi:MAG: error-prone DNA polymerase, partial [Nonlabens sp.]
MPASRQFTHQESEGYDEQVAWDDARARTAAEAVARRTSDAGSAVARAPAFTHLQTRSSYSLRDGAIRPRELAAAAAAAGMTHVALTDRDGLYGAVRFAKACLA